MITVNIYTLELIIGLGYYGPVLNSTMPRSLFETIVSSNPGIRAYEVNSDPYLYKGSYIAHPIAISRGDITDPQEVVRGIMANERNMTVNSIMGAPVPKVAPEKPKVEEVVSSFIVDDFVPDIDEISEMERLLEEEVDVEKVDHLPPNEAFDLLKDTDKLSIENFMTLSGVGKNDAIEFMKNKLDSIEEPKDQIKSEEYIINTNTEDVIMDEPIKVSMNVFKIYTDEELSEMTREEMANILYKRGFRTGDKHHARKRDNKALLTEKIKETQ